MADEAVSQGDYYRAAKTYLTLLSSNKKTDAFRGLSDIAEAAYEQKLAVATRLRDQGQLEASIPEYRELGGYLASLRQHNLLTFTAINTDQEIRAVSTAAADQYYDTAEQSFSNKQYRMAASSYKKVLELDPTYKDARNKLADSFYRIGAQLEEAGNFRQAIRFYEESGNTIPGFEDARERTGQIYYHLGDYFLDQGYCRQAYDEFANALAAGAQIADIGSKQSEAKECGTIKIALVELENITGRNLAGMNLGDIIFEKIRSKTMAKSSQFIQMMDRQQLSMLLREQDISEGMLREGSSLPSTVQGVDYLVFGKINQLLIDHNAPKKTPQRGKYELKVETPYTDEEGNRKTRTEWREYPLQYNLIEESMVINMGGAITAVNAVTGEIAVSHQIDQQAADQVAYVKEYVARHDLGQDGIRLSKQLVDYARAREELQDTNTLANGMIEAVSTQMAESILHTLDQAPTIADPTSIPLELPEVN